VSPQETRRCSLCSSRSFSRSRKTCTSRCASTSAPSSGPALEKQLTLPRGTNVVDATRRVAEVEQDWLCCSKDDVWAIGGVGPDTRLDRYWMWKLDGRMGPNFPVKHVLSEGERIEWVYSGGNQPVKLEVRAISLLPAATDNRRRHRRRACAGRRPRTSAGCPRVSTCHA
jgi:hypothetical protein